MTDCKEWVGRHWLTGKRICVRVAEGKVVSLTAVQDRLPHPEADWIAPGLIDLQVNGIHTVDFNDPTTTIEQIGRAVTYLHSIGVVRFCPTVVTNDRASMTVCIRRIAEACEADEAVARAVIGIHVEGPFLSAADGARGSHKKTNVRDPDWNEFLEWDFASGGRIAKVTLAPELAGSIDMIRRLSERGIVAAIGHTNAEEAHIQQAVEAGATMSTHLGNGSQPLLRRHPNHIWAQLAEDRLWAGFIADGHHLPASTLKVMVRAKRNKSILVSDVNHFEGYAPGRYLKRNHHEVILNPDGRLYMADAPDILSGAALGLHKGLERMAKFGICSLGEAIQMASLHPSELMGLCGSGHGLLEAGSNADFIRYRTNPGHDFEIMETVVAGNTVFSKKFVIT